MLQVVYSNKPEALCARLEQQLELDVGFPPRDALARIPLLAGSRPLAAWVQRQLSKRVGVIANVETLLLRRYVERLVEQLGGGARVLDRAAIRDLLLQRFLSGSLTGDDLAPVRRYLDAGDQRERDLRRLQLAAQVAGAFEEYLYTRPEMLDAWAAGKASHWHVADDELARWQRRLWEDLAAPLVRGEQRAPDGRRYLVPTRLLHESPARLAPEGTTLYVFGLSVIGRFFQRLLEHVAERSEVHLYALNPCMEFWEDLEPARGKPPSWRSQLPRRAPRRATPQLGLPLEGGDVLDLDLDGDCRLLQQWGRPGRESIRLLNESTQGGALGEFVDPAHRHPSLLHRLQRDLLQRRPAGEVERVSRQVESDGSLEIIYAPSVRRECEAVVARAWRLLDDPTLKLDDVAVLIAGEGDRYAAALQTAFAEGGPEAALPYQLAGIPYALSNPVVEAARLLIDLPTTRLTRADVLRALTHPLVAAGYDEGLSETWVSWVDALGIVHGADAEAHRGTYLEGLERLHWDQGLRRIGLGAFLSSRADGSELFFEHGGVRDLPDAAGAALRDGGGALLLLARSLLEDIRALAAARLTTRQWAEALAALFTTYLHPRDDAERRALEACRRATRSVAERDLGPEPYRYAIPRELVAEALAHVAPQGGGAVTGGVRISTLQASRGLPARVTFVVGLSEGAFPSAERPDPLDLRARKRRAGDVRPRERDCYYLLEALLCTGERLILTAPDRNEVTGEARAVSPVIDDLLSVLQHTYLPPPTEGEPPALIHRVPLWRGAVGDSGERHRFAPSRAALEEGSLQQAALTQSPRIEVGPGARARDVLRQMPSAAALEPLLHLPPVPPRAPWSSVEVRRVTFAQLAGFLRQPLWGAARVRLHLRREGEHDPLERTDEVFGLSALDRALLRRQVFLDGIRGRQAAAPTEADWIQAYRARVEFLEAAGWAPLGILAAPEQSAAVQRLLQWEHQLRRLRMNAAPVLREVRFGPAQEGEHVDEARAPLAFELTAPGNAGEQRPVRVELVGRTLPFMPFSSGPVGVLLNAADLPPGDLTARITRGCDGWLNLVARAASDPRGSPAARVALVGAERVAEIHVQKIAQAEARRYLEAILAELLWGENDFLFPLEPALKWLTRGREPFATFVIRSLTSRNAHLEEGPVPRAESYPIPSDAEAHALFEVRLGLLRDSIPELAEAMAHTARAAHR